MVILILKLILFAVLTSIPFLYHFLIKPRRESIKKYRNAFTAVQPQMSKLKKAITLLLLLSLLLFQGVDNFASSEVAATYKTMAKEKRLDQLSISGKKTAAPFMQRKMNNYLYPFLTRPLVYLITFGMTLLFFSYKLANRILTKIHNSKRILIGVSCVIILFSFFDEGRYILLSEVLFVIAMAALFYPNFHDPAAPKGRKPIPQKHTVERNAA